MLWRRCSDLSLAWVSFQFERGGDEEADGDDEQHQHWTWRRYNAHSGLPVFSGDLLHLMAERRFLLFLPMLPYGRQCSCFVESMVPCHGELAGPSGSVPGAGDLRSAERLLWIRLHFPFIFRGPPCYCQGHACIFRFLLGLVVRCSIPPLDEASGPSCPSLC